MHFAWSAWLGSALLVCASAVGIALGASLAGLGGPFAKPAVSKPLNDAVEIDLSRDAAQPDASDASIALYKARLAEFELPRAAVQPDVSETPWLRRRGAPASASPVARAAAGLPHGAALPLVAAVAPATVAALRSGEDRNCLATAIYYEARNQPIEGQEAVAQVIMNRVGRPQFAKTVCDVVAQGGEHRGCQFSFVCDGSLNHPPRDAAAWRLADSIAEMALTRRLSTPVATATFYHADYVSPWWSKVLHKVGQIGAHVFYQGLDRQDSRRGDPSGANEDAPFLPGGLLGGA